MEHVPQFMDDDALSRETDLVSETKPVETCIRLLLLNLEREKSETE
jgi:hypothetical protein